MTTRDTTSAGWPAYTSVETASTLLGLSRRTIYQMLGRGELRARKAGKRTLVDIPHALRYLENLPAAQIKPYRRKVEG
jgi:excisionase family DNA binding protein